MKEKENQLCKKVTFRMTEAEFAKLKKLSEAGNLSLSDTCRTIINRTEIRERSMSTEQRQELFKQLAHIGGNLNQIARRLNQGSAPAEEQKTLKRVLDGYTWLWKKVEEWHI